MASTTEAEGIEGILTGIQSPDYPFFVIAFGTPGLAREPCQALPFQRECSCSTARGHARAEESGDARSYSTVQGTP